MALAAESESTITVRPLAREDLAAVVEIDAVVQGRSRRTYFERRLAAAVRAPRVHAQFGATDACGLAGYILGRVLEGEFGRTDAGLRLEVVGVRRDAQGRGVGTELFDALLAWSRRHAIRELRTQAAWNEHAMLHWLEAMRFTLAPEHVLECTVGGGAYTPERDDPMGMPDAASQEIDYGTPTGDRFERLARDLVDVRAMSHDDLAGIVRIDGAITGRDREAYIRAKHAEAMVDSAIRVSLCTRLDDAVVGFVMASVDLGDFGRAEPVAVLDTIGVDPAYAHRGVGHALVSQLFTNLGALRIERVETLVAPRDFSLQGFLHAIGFTPSQRIAFVRPIGNGK